MSFFITFTWGFVLYPFIEILWRGYTHPAMCFAGGICSSLIFFISRFDLNIFLKAFLGAVAVTSVEFVFGLIFNIILKMNVWDYSQLPLNFMGQICAGYFVLWYFISLILIFVYHEIRFVFV